MNQELKEKLAALLALKNRAATAGEAAAALAGIMRLLRRHNLSIDINDLNEEELLEEDYVMEQYDLGTSSPYPYGQGQSLLGLVAKHNFCSVIGKHHSNKKRTTITIIGQPSNIEVVKQIYNYLREEMRHLTRNTWKVAKKPNLNEQLWKRSFFQGMLVEIRNRFDEMVRPDLENENTHALVVVKDKKLKEAIADLYGKTKISLPRSVGVYESGFAGGKELAKSIKIRDELKIKRVALNA